MGARRELWHSRCLLVKVFNVQQVHGHSYYELKHQIYRPHCGHTLVLECCVWIYYEIYRIIRIWCVFESRLEYISRVWITVTVYPKHREYVCVFMICFCVVLLAFTLPIPRYLTIFHNNGIGEIALLPPRYWGMRLNIGKYITGIDLSLLQSVWRSWGHN